MTTPAQPQTPEKKGLFLKLRDFKLIEQIIEEYNLNKETNEVDFNNMKDDEKQILWKVKTIIRNMEAARLRPKENLE